MKLKNILAMSKNGYLFKNINKKTEVIYLFHQRHVQVGNEHMISYFFLFIAKTFPFGKLIHWMITSSLFLFFKMSFHLVVVEKQYYPFSNC